MRYLIKSSHKTVFFLIILFQILGGCSLKWTEAIRRGEVAQNGFRETIPIEINKGLIFLPVTIEGKEYRFLFDSGAPLSISEELQRVHAFEIISTGNIIDSDHNRKKVNWVQLDSLSIGAITFVEQTAFIGDFKANPLLACLGIDGIVGSNLIRQCNWTLDQEEQLLLLHDTLLGTEVEGYNRIPIKTDEQYNMFIDLMIGDVTLRNVLIDFGSNGSLSLSNEIFSTIKSHNAINDTFLEKGVQQSGIIGEPILLNREFTITDSVSLGGLNLKNVLLRTGKTVSIGNKLLSRFRTIIDLDAKNFYISKNGEIKIPEDYAGFALGYSAEKGIYIQSVVENSNAYKSGVRPDMKVLQLDSLDFEKGQDFCDYVYYHLNDSIYLRLIDTNEYIRECSFDKTPY